jgi:hypothetical protein
MQSLDRLLYLRGYFTFFDVGINGTQMPEYYLMREFIVVRTDRATYSISTGVPNPYRATSVLYYGHVTDWLMNFQLAQ